LAAPPNRRSAHGPYGMWSRSGRCDLHYTFYLHRYSRGNQPARGDPVFVDIDPGTFNIDPKKVEKAVRAVIADDSSIHSLPFVNSKLKTQNLKLTPKAVIPVDLFGLPADYDAINRIAKEHGLFVIEDAAQSFGAEYKGRKACSLTDIACTSFFPAKPLGCYGDGGMCFTDDDNLAEIMRSIRSHGQGNHKYENIRVGINGRLDTLQAAILLAKFEIFSEEIERRQKVATKYTELLTQNSKLKTQNIPAGYISAWAQYSILTEDEAKRDALMDNLKAAGIPTAIYYPKPLHLQGAFTVLGYRAGDFPVSEDCANRIFSLPCIPISLRKIRRELQEAYSALNSVLEPVTSLW